MRTHGGYRFSLQFGADSEEKVRVGDFLERMGNRKSVMIINAVSHYLDDNPKLESSGNEVKVQINALMKKEEIESLIRTIIEERMAGMSSLSTPENSAPSVQKALEEDITSMLSNLALFG